MSHKLVTDLHQITFGVHKVARNGSLSLPRPGVLPVRPPEICLTPGGYGVRGERNRGHADRPDRSCSRTPVASGAIGGPRHDPA